MSDMTLKPEQLQVIAEQVREEYRAAVARTRQVASKLDELNRLQARAKASPRAISSASGRKKPISIF